MSSGFTYNGVDLSTYFQPWFTGSTSPTTINFTINNISISSSYARRDNNVNNAVSVNLGFTINDVDITTLFNKINPSLTITPGGSVTYNGQPQQATITLNSPTDSWITVTSSTKTNAGTYAQGTLTYTYPSSYVLSVNAGNFIINPSTINIVSNGGPSSFSWTDSPISFSNYLVNGVYAEDTNWSVSGTSQTSVGSYSATLSTTSSNYTLGTSTLGWSITAIAPGVPTIGTSTSGDKSFTANWTAPLNNGGATITYYVSYSTNDGNTWSTEATTTSLTYTWSGNSVIFNGNTYKARVRATNSSNLFSDYSAKSNGQVPTFAAPTLSIVLNAPSTSTPGVRTFYINYTPTACVDYSYTIIYVNSWYDSYGQYYSYVNNSYSNITTNTTGNQNTASISSVYAQNFYMGGGFYNVGPDEAYSAYCITYNNDGYNVQSSTASTTTQVRQYSPPVYTYYSYSTATGTFTVTGNAFTQTSVYAIPDNDTTITGLTVNAASNGTVTICTSGRYFVVYFANQSTTNFNQSLSGLQNPWNNNSGTTVRSKAWPSLTASGYGQSGNGKIKVNGAGTIGTWATNQRTNVTVSISGQQRTNTGY